MKKCFSHSKKLFISALIFSFFVLQISSYAQGPEFGINTDNDVAQVFGFWDLRERDTFVQFTNLDFSAPVTVHVQLFNVTDNCTEFDFFDTYTPGDTFVYDISSLARNNGQNLDPPIYSENSHGIIVITAVNAVGGISLGESEASVVGNSRIIDSSGYEYRTNLPGARFGVSANLNVGFNFSSVNGNPQFADVVGFLLVNTGGGVDHSAGNGVEASIIQGAAVIAEITLYDQSEQPISCDLTAFVCTEENSLVSDFIGGGELGINFGINDAIVNSKGRPALCDGTDPVGHVLVEPVDFGLSLGGPPQIIEGRITFVGFTGLNNGTGTGSYDSWFSVEGFDRPF